MSKYINKRLTDAGITVDLRVVDNFKWKWADFEAAVPGWSVIPCVIRGDGQRISNNADLVNWIGPDPEHAKEKATPLIPK
jgi:hypothetical protein